MTAGRARYAPFDPMAAHQQFRGQARQHPDSYPGARMTCFHDRPYPPEAIMTTRRTLALWNQFAPRVYMQVALCFPFAGVREEAVNQINASLRRLKHQQPAYAAHLEADSEGQVHLIQRPNDEIPFNTVDYTADFPFRGYEHLKEKGFPSNAFVHPKFLRDGSLYPKRSAPVCQISVSFLDGGMIVWVSIHHSFTDGAGLGNFLECFAAHTRCSPGDSDHDLGTDSIRSQALVAQILSHTMGESGGCFDELLRKCNEYKRAPASFQPLPNPTTTARGNIFVFQNKKLNEAKDYILKRSPEKRPSTFAILATLAWAHITKARLMAEAPATESEALDHALLQLCVEWRGRTFQSNSKRYYGVRSKISSRSLNPTTALE